MRLTLQTDFALRVLIYLAVAGEEGGTIAEIAEGYGISGNHLMKVVQRLSALGFVSATRGRGGGLHLARPANEIRVGDVARKMEQPMVLVECFAPETNTCVITPACGLKSYLADAQEAFFAALDGVTVADAAGGKRKLRSLLALGA